MNLRAIRFLSVLLLTALLLLNLPMALASSEFEAVVTSHTMKVYRQSEPHDQIGELDKGTVVTVKDYKGDAALISYKGYTGIAHVSDMERVSEKSEKAEEKAETASSEELKNAKAVVTTKKVKVYKKAKKSSDYKKVDGGTKLNLLAVSGKWAKVERNGAVGYVYAKYLKEVGSEEEVHTVNETVMTKERCKVYAKPSSSSDHMTLEKGVVMTMVATQGDWAKVRKDGHTGYIDRSHLTTEVTTADIKAEDEKKTDDKSDIFSGSNEQIIFKFLTREADYNTAAACGILANIKYESGYKATTNGDSGASFGICQWYAARKTRLINWCDSHGYDYTTLKGQLYFLKYELKEHYPAVHKKLKGVDNSAQGAYDAGYEFCYNFEAPSNRASRSETRGKYARDTLWDRYKS